MFALPVSAENLQITDAWIKNLPTVVPVRARYMEISNKQNRTITILSLESNAFESIEIQQSIDQDGVTRTQAIASLSIRPDEMLELAPGGFHLMMMNSLEQLIPGK